MSESDSLADSFGQPARSLSTMLPPRRRRSIQEQTPSGQAGGDASNAPPGSVDTTEQPQQALESATTTPDDSITHNAPTSIPRPVAPSPDREAGDETAPSPARNRGATTTRRGSARAGGRPAAVTELEDHTSYQIVVYVHPSVKAIALAQRREHKVSNAEIAFDAIDAVQHRLDALIKTRRLQSRPESSLFPGRVRRGRVGGGGGAVAAAGEARRVLWGFRATGQELAVIDRLAERSGAESRSELVATALEEVLLQTSTAR